MNTSALVSVIIPTYNYGHFISETLNCLIHQEYQYWEAIVIDDGSTDNTKQIVEGFNTDKRIKYFFKQNAGLSAARNTGIEKASGSYLLFLDSDDLLSQKKLKIQVEYMEKHKDCTISYTLIKYFKDNDLTNLYASYHLDQTEWIPKVSGKFNDILDTFIKTIMPVNSPMIRTSFIKEYKLRFDIGYKSYEDWEFWLRCLDCGAQYNYISDTSALALIRVHGKSMRTKSFTMAFYDLNLRKKMQFYIHKYQQPNQASLHKYNHRNILFACRCLLSANNKFNLDGFKIVYKEVGFLKTLILSFKELNVLRKSR